MNANWGTTDADKNVLYADDPQAGKVAVCMAVFGKHEPEVDQSLREGWKFHYELADRTWHNHAELFVTESAVRTKMAEVMKTLGYRIGNGQAKAA